MQLGNEEQAILSEVARQRGVSTTGLEAALERESAAELAAALCIEEGDATRHMDRVRRAVTIGDDWGAGCMLLTDDVRAELQAALRALLPDAPHSASPGVSQG